MSLMACHFYALLSRFQSSNGFGRSVVTVALLAGLWLTICNTGVVASPRIWANQGLGATRQPSWMPFAIGDRTPHPAIARISAVDCNGLSQGSGTLVEVRNQHGLVITNWHVIRDAKGPIVATFPDGFRSAATVLKVDQDWDLAALLIWRPNATPVSISMTAPRPGDPLTIAGYGAGEYRAVSGRCTQYVAPGRNMPYEMVEVSAEARQGDSGGPILNESGELAGVLFGAGGGTTSGSFCGRVRRFLESAWPAEQTPNADTFVSVPTQQPITRWPSDGLVAVPQVATPRIPTISESRPNYTTGSTLSPATISSGELNESATRENIQKLVGTNPVEQAKTVLAAIGILAVFLQVAKSVGGHRARP
ncbi:MAG: trypsin-like peptidase domain-containing protein [Planctomycetia bacterium]|nr:trypsin-like peptidase domain-containing protein [Planctomycetia bacterium]